MTMTTFARCAPSWMGDHRKAVTAAALGALAASVVLAAAVVAWPGGEASAPAAPHVGTVTYPPSREGVRGHIFDTGDALGVTVDAVQPSAAEPKHPPSREGVRGHIFDTGEALGVTADAVQPPAAGPKYPPSREGVRGHIFD